MKILYFLYKILLKIYRSTMQLFFFVNAFVKCVTSQLLLLLLFLYHWKLLGYKIDNLGTSNRLQAEKTLFQIITRRHHEDSW